MSNNPKIPSQRGPVTNITAKTAKAPAAFQPEYVNGSLNLSGPKNGRPGKLSQYTQDLLVYVGALEKETIGLRDKQSSLDAKITELNGTITGLEQRIAANSEQHQRDMANAKSTTRAANATMDVERTRANMAEALEDTRQQIHDLFDGASLSELSTSRGTMNGALVRSAFFTCAGLRFSRRISSTDQSLAVWSAPDNPIKLRDHVITRFAGNDLHVADKAYLRFLREAATVEGYEHNKERLTSKELEQLYRMHDIVKVFGCGHSVIEHNKMREELLLRFTPTVVTMVFDRLEGNGSTDNHSTELTRAIMISAGMNEAMANAWARSNAEEKRSLDQAKQKLRSESYNSELAKALGEYALSGTVDFDEVLDLRPENLRLKPRASEALHLLQRQDGPLYHGALGLRGEIKPIIGEYNREPGDYAPLRWDSFREFPKSETHDLGTDSLYDVSGGQPCVDGRPAVKDIKPEHSGDCRNNGATENCTHPDHRSKN